MDRTIIFLILLLCASPSWGRMSVPMMCGGATTTVTAGFVGNSNTAGTGNSSAANQGMFQLYAATTSGTIGYCHMDITDGDTGHFNIAVYNADGSTKLADGTLVVASGSPDIIDITLDSPITITATTSYYLFGGSSDDAFWRIQDIDGTGANYYYDVPTTVGDTMPDPMDTGGTQKTNASLRIWCDNTATGS